MFVFTVLIVRLSSVLACVQPSVELRLLTVTDNSGQNTKAVCTMSVTNDYIHTYIHCV